jgi:hypothetical protein
VSLARKLGHARENGLEGASGVVRGEDLAVRGHNNGNIVTIAQGVVEYDDELFAIPCGGLRDLKRIVGADKARPPDSELPVVGIEFPRVD